MRNPNRLFLVLRALLQPPFRAGLLADPELLVANLRGEWLEEGSTNNGAWYIAGEHAVPGSQVASDYAALPCRVEEELAILTLEQLQALGTAVESVCPEALETFSLLTSSPLSIYMPPKPEEIATDQSPEPYRFAAPPEHRARAALARKQIKTVPEILRQAHEESGPKGVARGLKSFIQCDQAMNWAF